MVKILHWLCKNIFVEMADYNRYYAHSLRNRPQAEWQPLKEHLLNVAEITKKFAESFNAGEWGYVAGLLHDIGKYSQEFQVMLAKVADNDVNLEGKIGHPDHSTAGAQEINKLKGGLGRLIAYAIASHHSGLLDGKSNEACLYARLKKNIPDYSSCPSDFIEVKNKITTLPFTPAEKNNERIAFQLQLFIRMLFSSLVDADFLDTEAFMDKDKSSLRKSYLELSDMRKQLIKALDKLSREAPDTLINKRRREILRQCLDKSHTKPGLFSLTVPTGGGKTLSSLAFAMEHAVKHRMRRIIYVIPYTSIIEQNANIFKNIFGDDAVLEHHSNFEMNENNYQSQLASENWDAPLVVTTNVQFFESLFHNKTSQSRKIHNIANSVVILDEAQMIPVSLLKPCMEVLRELAESYKNTIVLCSATQPAISKTDEFKNGLENVREIIEEPIKLYNEFNRVEITSLSKTQEKTSDVEVAQKISEHKQVLCVVNTRKHARLLYEQISNKEGLYHLSALMCPVHRSKVIKKIKQTLENNEQCRVVSTQLIEAGVDIDFPVVFRSAAGIDSIAQSAGRCNREGRLGRSGKVYVFYPENVLPIGHLRQSAEVTETIMRKYTDLLSPDTIKEYFRHLYWRNQDSLDKYGIINILMEGLSHDSEVNFSFKAISEKFRVIDNTMESIVIPYNDEAKEIVKQLRFAEFPKGLLRKVQRFCVQVYPNVLRELFKDGAIRLLSGNFFELLNEHLYREKIGLDYSNPVFRDVEKDII